MLNVFLISIRSFLLFLLKALHYSLALRMEPSVSLLSNHPGRRTRPHRQGLKIKPMKKIKREVQLTEAVLKQIQERVMKEQAAFRPLEDTVHSDNEVSAQKVEEVHE